MSTIYLIIAFILALTLHEFAHAWMGTYLGDDTARLSGRLSLNPMAHIDPIMTLLLPALLILAHSPVIFGAAKPVPFNPWKVRYGKWGVALVALAGPMTNFILAGFFSLWLRFIPINNTDLFVQIIVTNVALGVFNLIPFPPLDGSRLIYAMAPDGLQELMDRIERLGLMAFFLFFILLSPFLSRFVQSITASILHVLIPGLTSL